MRISDWSSDVCSSDLFKVTQSVPVAAAGPMTFLYPKWLPGHHSPSGPLDKLAGLVFREGGKVLPWTRDKVDMYAYHIDVPEGAKTIDIAFTFLSANKSTQGRIPITHDRKIVA